MADALDAVTAEHEARVQKDLQDRAAIEVAEGVTVPPAISERGLFLALAERAKPFLAKYGHVDLTHFLSAVGSDALLARRVIGELVEDRFAAEPETPAAPAEDPRIASLQADLDSAREVLKGYDAKFDGLTAQLEEAAKTAEHFKAEAATEAAAGAAALQEVSDTIKDGLAVKAQLAESEANLQAALAKSAELEKQIAAKPGDEPAASGPAVEATEGEHAA